MRIDVLFIFRGSIAISLLHEKKDVEYIFIGAQIFMRNHLIQLLCDAHLSVVVSGHMLVLYNILLGVIRIKSGIDLEHCFLCLKLNW